MEGLPHSPLCDLGFQCRRLLATLRQRSQVTLQRCHTSVQSYENMNDCPRAEMGDSFTSLNRSMERHHRKLQKSGEKHGWITELSKHMDWEEFEIWEMCYFNSMTIGGLAFQHCCKVDTDLGEG